MPRRLNLRPQLLLVATVLTGALASLEHGIARAENEQGALTAEEWTRKYWCDLAPANSTLVQSNLERKLLIDGVPWAQRFWYNIMNECCRDQTGWRVNYIDELIGDKVLIRDSSLDERLANILKTLNFHSLTDNSYFLFNSGHPETDLANELRVASPSVDDDQCAADLYEMVEELDELTELVSLLRREPNRTQPLERRHIKLARVLDAYGRYESGSLSGNLRLAGFYNQCIKATLERRQSAGKLSKAMEMRYCWARVSLHERLNTFIKRRQEQAHESGDDALLVGACLPASCHTRNLKSDGNKRLVKKLLDSQLVFPQTIYMEQHPELASVLCLPDADSLFLRMPASGQVWIAFTAGWILISCLATYLKVGQQPREQSDEQLDGVAQLKEQQMSLIARLKEPQQEQREQQDGQLTSGKSAWRDVVKCFNLRLSWADFISDRAQRSRSSPVDLDVLEPIKVATCLGCTIVHVSFMYVTQSQRLLDTVAQVERDMLLQIAVANSIGVDTFFVITGFLISFIVCKKLARMAARRQLHPTLAAGFETNHGKDSSKGNTWGSLRNLAEFMGAWLLIAANRYLRLVPLYAFFFYFRRDVFKYLGSGPFWDHGLNRNTMTGACDRSSAWTPFNLATLEVPLMKQCLTTAWTVQADILYGLLVPPLLLLLHKRPKPTLRAMCALVILSSIYALKVLMDEPQADRFEYLELRLHGYAMQYSTLTRVYTSPSVRAGAFLIGAIAGYALFNYAQNRTPHCHWPHWLTGIATKLSTIYLLLHILVPALQMDFRRLLSPYHRLYAAYMLTLDRIVWSVANAVLFLRMTTDWRHGPFMSLFAHQLCKSLARLSYSLLYVHWMIVLAQMGTVKSLPDYSFWDLVGCNIQVYVVSLPISFLVHLVFENPMDKLIKKLIFRI